jgi:hypothetical protein
MRRCTRIDVGTRLTFMTEMVLKPFEWETVEL